MCNHTSKHVPRNEQRAAEAAFFSAISQEIPVDTTVAIRQSLCDSLAQQSEDIINWAANGIITLPELLNKMAALNARLPVSTSGVICPISGLKL